MFRNSILQIRLIREHTNSRDITFVQKLFHTGKYLFFNLNSHHLSFLIKQKRKISIFYLI